PGEDRVKIGLGLPAQLCHQRPALVRHDRHLVRSGTPMTRAAGLGVVDAKVVVRMLEGRNPDPSPREFFDKANDEGGFASFLPASEADRRATWRRRPHVLPLMACPWACPWARPWACPWARPWGCPPRRSGRAGARVPVGYWR